MHYANAVGVSLFMSGGSRETQNENKNGYFGRGSCYRTRVIWFGLKYRICKKFLEISRNDLLSVTGGFLLLIHSRWLTSHAMLLLSGKRTTGAHEIACAARRSSGPRLKSQRKKKRILILELLQEPAPAQRGVWASPETSCNDRYIADRSEFMVLAAKHDQE
jgi:hypothetical protein